MNNIFKLSGAQKVLMAIQVIMVLIFFIGLACGVGFIIGLFGVGINYLKVSGIGAFIWLFLFLAIIGQWLAVKNAAKNIEAEFGKW